MTQSNISSSVLSPEMLAFLKRHINFHRILWAMILVSFFIAWNRGLTLLYGLFSLLIALQLISYLLPKWQLRKIRVERKHHGDLSVGNLGSIAYRLSANGTRYHIELIESLEFADQEEQHHFFGKLSGLATCHIQFNCRRRGCFQLQSILLSSAYPFGVIQFSRTVPTDPMEVLVFPEVVSLSRLPMPLMATTNTWGDVLIPQKGGRDEFATVREYVHGDELKNVHWPVSARQQHLVVKEYENTNRPAILIVLDCLSTFDVGRAPLSTFEFAVSIAASMIQKASREGIQCFLVARDDRLHEMTVPAYATDFYALNELLARLNCDSRHAYQPLVSRAHKRFPQANLITTFQLASNRTQIELSPHVTQIVMEMDDDSFRFPQQAFVDSRPRQEGNRLIYPVHAKQRLETVFQ